MFLRGETPRRTVPVSALLLALLLLGGPARCSGDTQVERQEAHDTAEGWGQDGGEGGGGGGGAFFALRSCHQVLHGDSGEFFSPDYLCSNPPLWCNWTIHVDPGKRVRLHLEDLTPDDACHLKQDQIHVDEPVGKSRGHKVLQRCWREAKYISGSDTLYVVLLIGGQPSSPYRGFYGRYQAFGPPVVYNPQEPAGEPWLQPGMTELPLDQTHFTKFVPALEGEPTEAADLEHHTMTPPPPSENYDLMYDYYDQASAPPTELPWEEQELPEEDTTPKTEEEGNQVGENHLPDSESHNDESWLTSAPATLVSSHGTSRLERDVVQTPSGRPDRAAHPLPSHERPESEPQPKPSAHTPTAKHRNVDAQTGAPITSAVPEESAIQRPTEAETPPWDDEAETEVSEASEQHLPPPFDEADEAEPTEAEEPHPHPNMVEPLSDLRGNVNSRNHSGAPHLPGDHLFEVAVEVTFPQDSEQPWDQLARSLLISVKALINQHLDVLYAPKSMSSKRIKRLSAGVLYILWLQVRQGPGSSHMHRAVHAALQGLLATAVGPAGLPGKAVVVSVSTADVNECGTQLVLCDINAECVNRFGSYSCRCRPGFQDESRLGSGGTVCVDVKAAGCSSGSSAETRGVYVLFFLLSSLILMLLAAAGVLYRRRHRGAFPIHCHSSGSVCPPDLNNNNNHHHQQGSYSGPADAELPPPPPPVRRPRDGWAPLKDGVPAVDLPLLRFTPLTQDM
ncbi:uncharacterized protein LOC115364443 [Myripristis murdjan]|uniref:Uncharacterized LOC115364443 n=1 Tax=Myripristis murdjan TaxID=586833 RepID=A0A667Y349_9TELE|nr:uncharacterized protein LOC115364443 [Myripristis murdjan]